MHGVSSIWYLFLQKTRFTVRVNLKALRFFWVHRGLFLCYNTKRHICILLVKPSAKSQRGGLFLCYNTTCILRVYKKCVQTAHVCACVLSATKNKGIDWAGGFCYTSCCIVATLSISRLVGSPAGRVYFSFLSDLLSSLTLSLELLAVGVVSIFCTSRLTFSCCCTLEFLADLLLSFSFTLRPSYRWLNEILISIFAHNIRKHEKMLKNIYILVKENQVKQPWDIAGVLCLKNYKTAD